MHQAIKRLLLAVVLSSIGLGGSLVANATATVQRDQTTGVSVVATNIHGADAQQESAHRGDHTAKMVSDIEKGDKHLLGHPTSKTIYAFELDGEQHKLDSFIYPDDPRALATEFRHNHAALISAIQAKLRLPNLTTDTAAEWSQQLSAPEAVANQVVDGTVDQIADVATFADLLVARLKNEQTRIALSDLLEAWRHGERERFSEIWWHRLAGITPSFTDNNIELSETMRTLTGVAFSERSRFSTTAGVRYATKYATRRAPGMMYFTGNDCTNFASQIKQAEGHHQNSLWYWNPEHWSKTWTVADAFAKHWHIQKRASRFTDFASHMYRGRFIGILRSDGVVRHIGFVHVTGGRVHDNSGTYNTFGVCQHSQDYCGWVHANNRGKGWRDLNPGEVWVY